MQRFIESLEGRRLANGTWHAAPSMPAALGEVAAGVIGDKLYVVGETNDATFVFDNVAHTWTSAPARPLPGNHHAAEVVNGKLYLFGGLTAGSEGRVQIFDPASGTWSLGADMPFAAGSSSSALINGQVYVAGGIVGEHTTNRTARYDAASNSWAELAAMPQGRNHTAAGTDGQKLFVFGGRGPGSGDRNVTTNGFDTTQVYDPATNTWDSSLSAGSTLAPLPQARGGMGKAVYLNGEFYVIGGETLTGAGATGDGVYDRVDVYNPTTNTWRLETPMPTARHGIFPVGLAGGIFVAGGGTHFGGSQSAALEAFSPPPSPPVPPAPEPATVVGRWVFYNNSAYDGNDPAADARDDSAIAADKQALLPGQRASFGNYTSYSRGINGVMIDVANLPAAATPGRDDFVFTSGNSADPTQWSGAAAQPAAIAVRRGAGVSASDRVTITWPDEQLRNTWLRVSAGPGGQLGLAAPEVFYFGNAVGETGNRAVQVKRRRPDARVNAADLKLVNRARRRPGTDALARFDFDRNGVVDLGDRAIARANRTRKKRAALDLIVAP
jgi:N-acetylneuraminic acid mutarotase